MLPARFGLSLNDPGFTAGRRASRGEQVLRSGGHTGSQVGIVDQLEGTEDVMCIFEAPLGHYPVEDDLFGLLQLEFGALDPIREVSLDEREGRERIGLFSAAREGSLHQLCLEGIEQLQSPRVEPEASLVGACCSGFRLGCAGAQNHADHVVKRLHLRVCVERAGHLPGPVA